MSSKVINELLPIVFSISHLDALDKIKRELNLVAIERHLYSIDCALCIGLVWSLFLILGRVCKFRKCPWIRKCCINEIHRKSTIYFCNLLQLFLIVLSPGVLGYFRFQRARNSLCRMGMIWDLVFTVFSHLSLIICEREYRVTETFINVVCERISH